MNMNFKNYGNERMQLDGGIGSGQPPGNFPLVRQGSIYALTFDELQSTMGSVGKDFGSMNMDELLKNIWNAEEVQTMGNNTNGVQDHGGVPGGFLQRQGSLTLPRTLSQKTVDEVWKDISKEYNSGFGEASFQPQRQQTLGEMTLEEFLLKAGVVREENQVAAEKPIDNGLFGNLQNSQNNSSFGIGFQQPNRNTGVNVMANSRITENGNQIAFQSPNLPLSVNGVRSNTQQQQNQQQQNQQQQLFPKPPALQAYGPPMAIPTNGHLGSPGIRNGHIGSPGIRGGGIMGLSDPIMNGNLVASAGLQGGGMGVVSLAGGGVTVANGSPALSSDGMGRSTGDTSSVSPAPYVFSGVLRGRKCSAVEKVVERRQRRMIKNRESAARSRARKQAYTMELEAEVAKLKEQNEELLKKQEEIMEMQKNQAMEMMNMQKGGKRRCLRRTQTGPW